MIICNWADFDSELNLIVETINTRKKNIPPFIVLSSEDNPSLQRVCAETYAKKFSFLKGKFDAIPQSGVQKKIKIGYFSADFHNHATAYLIAGFFEAHNRDSFETYWGMWHYLLQIAPVGFVAPVACLFATLAYERGDTALAYRALDRATADQPAYSLTILLRRVFGSGWPAGAFAAMRVELHPKVTAGIFG
jgi:hypothetical protein